VCDDGWTDNDAAVICYQIGYSYYSPEATFGSVFGLSDELGSVFGVSDETPVLQNPMCNGNEYYLSDCPGYDLNNVTGDYCLGGEYQAGVRCVDVPTPTAPCPDGNLFLANSTYSYIDGNYFCLHRLHLVTTDNFSWKSLHMTTIIETISMEAELNCATMKSTIPSVLRNGQTTMLQLSVTTSATHPHPIVHKPREK
jgi:hypothetical protein